MSILPIITIPNPVLKQRATEIKEITPEIQQLASDMIETMYNADGIGLAAPQIDQSLRIFVLDVEQDNNERYDTSQKNNANIKMPHVFINPEIIQSSTETNDYEEGCLSIPGVLIKITRPKSIRLRYMDIHGTTHEIDADGLLATCIQHELDHLDGVLITDRLSKLKQRLATTKSKKHAKMMDYPTL